MAVPLCNEGVGKSEWAFSGDSIAGRWGAGRATANQRQAWQEPGMSRYVAGFAQGCSSIVPVWIVICSISCHC